MPDSAQSLRARAAVLRRQASQLDADPLAAVRQRAGESTWIGATALAFRDELHQADQVLRAAADGLHRQARSLQLRADALAQLDAAARALSLVAGRT